jgi:hypothetical protein
MFYLYYSDSKSAFASIIVHLLVQYFTMKISSYILMAPNLCSRLSFFPDVMLPSQKLADNPSSFIVLFAPSRGSDLEMDLQSLGSFYFRQVPSHALEEQYAEMSVRSGEHSMRHGFTHAISHNFETLVDLDNKRTRYAWKFDALTTFVECMEDFGVGWGRLEQELPPP